MKLCRVLWCILALSFMEHIYALDMQLVGLVNEYKKNGIGAIESKLESYLSDKEYWAEYLRSEERRVGKECGG